MMQIWYWPVIHLQQCVLLQMQIQCSAIIMQSVFTQILTKGTPWLACQGELWDVLCEFNLWLISVLVTAVLYTIKHIIEPRCNISRPYYVLQRSLIILNSLPFFFIPFLWCFWHLQSHVLMLIVEIQWDCMRSLISDFFLFSGPFWFATFSQFH